MLTHPGYEVELGRGRRTGSCVAAGNSGGGNFPFLFTFSPRARSAFRPGDGPRAFGFSM